MAEPLVTGTIEFAGEPPPLANARIYVWLEQTSTADAPAQPVASSVLSGAALSHDASGRIPFIINGDAVEPGERYTVRVHADRHGGDGRSIRTGDYVTTESYPVLTYGYPHQVRVVVHPV